MEFHRFIIASLSANVLCKEESLQNLCYGFFQMRSNFSVNMEQVFQTDERMYFSQDLVMGLCRVQTLWLITRLDSSLIPKLLSVFQRCTQKNEGAW